MNQRTDAPEQRLARLCQDTAPDLLVSVLKGELLIAWETAPLSETRPSNDRYLAAAAECRLRAKLDPGARCGDVLLPAAELLEAAAQGGLSVAQTELEAIHALAMNPQDTAPKEGDPYTLSLLKQLLAIRLAPSAIGAPITDNDRRWRHLEHGCQWVSWTETNGETHSFDPRNVGTGYQGDLQSMRATADEQLERQVAKLKSATSDGGSVANLGQKLRDAGYAEVPDTGRKPR